MTEDKKAKILDRVRGLVSKAQATDFDEERDAFLAKADELMTLYAIESYELEMEKPADERQKPEVRQFDYKTTNNHMREELAPMFHALARLCRCEIGFYGWSYSKVVGYPADLDYLDLLLTSVMIQFASKMDPKPDPQLKYEDNLYMLKTAGFKWQKIYELMAPIYPDKFKQGLDTLSYDEVSKILEERPYQKGSYLLDHKNRLVYKRTIPRNIGVRFTAEYKKHCEANNLDRVMTNPETYQRSFAVGFRHKLISRINEMRRDQEKATEGHGLVLASREGDLKESLWENFPDTKPCPPGCTCSKHKPIRYRREAEKKVDEAALRRGSSAASNVDLSGGRKHIGQQKGLES